jgi:hypothetical protein
MEKATLKYLRILTPGIVALVGWAILGSLTGLWEYNGITVEATLPPLCIGALYYTLGIRYISNFYFYKQVNQNLRLKLLEAGGLDPSSCKLQWEHVRPVFYYYVDNDASIKNKSQDVMFNGYIWGTAADIRAFSLVYSLVSLGMSLIDPAHWVATAAFALMSAASLLLSWALTVRHKRLGDEQIQVIETNHDDLRARLQKLL